MAARRICVITGSRAEYGLLHWVMREIADEAGSALASVIVTSAARAQSRRFAADGLREIDADGYRRRRDDPFGPEGRERHLQSPSTESTRSGATIGVGRRRWRGSTPTFVDGHRRLLRASVSGRRFGAWSASVPIVARTMAAHHHPRFQIEPPPPLRGPTAYRSMNPNRVRGLALAMFSAETPSRCWISNFSIARRLPKPSSSISATDSCWSPTIP